MINGNGGPPPTIVDKQAAMLARMATVLRWRRAGLVFLICACGFMQGWILGHLHAGALVTFAMIAGLMIVFAATFAVGADHGRFRTFAMLHRHMLDQDASEEK